MSSLKFSHMFPKHKRHSTAGLHKPEDTIKTEYETAKHRKKSVAVMEGIDEEATIGSPSKPTKDPEDTTGKIKKNEQTPEPPEPPPEKVIATSGGDGEDPDKPKVKKQIITIWQLLVRKKYLMRNIHPDMELPLEEDLLDRFSIIDYYSRRIFPTFFTIIFTIYWILFNYYISDRFPSEVYTSPPNGLIE